MLIIVNFNVVRKIRSKIIKKNVRGDYFWWEIFLNWIRGFLGKNCLYFLELDYRIDKKLNIIKFFFWLEYKDFMFFK